MHDSSGGMAPKIAKGNMGTRLSRLLLAAALGVSALVTACGGGGGGNGPASLQGKSVETVSATMACADLTKQDLTGLAGASATVTSAGLVGTGTAAYCSVKGLITGTVNYEVRLPPTGWTQRFLMIGCGGYCGAVPAPIGQARQMAGCVPFETNQMVTAASVSDIPAAAPLVPGQKTIPRPSSTSPTQGCTRRRWWQRP